MYIALLVVSESIKKVFSIDFVNIYLFSIIFFNKFCPVQKFRATQHCLYRDLLTLMKTVIFGLMCVKNRGHVNLRVF